MIGMVFWEQNKNPKRAKKFTAGIDDTRIVSKTATEYSKVARSGDYRGRGTHGDPSQAFPRIPQWVAYAACAAFLLVGIALTAQGFGFASVAKRVAPLMEVALAGIATWIGFAPGERECTSGFSFFGLGGSGVSSCKPAFAIAAILIWVFFAAVLWFNYLRKPPKD